MKRATGASSGKLNALNRLKRKQEARPVTQIKSINSDTVELEAVLRATDQREFDGKVSNYAELLVLDPTSLIDDDDDILKKGVDKEGKETPAVVVIDRAAKKLGVRISKTSKYDENLAAWQKYNVNLKDLEATYYEVQGPTTMRVKVVAMPPNLQPNTTVRVALSALKWLLDPPAPGQPAGKIPMEPGLSVKAESLQRTGEANSPMLFAAHVEKPEMCNLPIKSYEEMKKLDKITTIVKYTQGSHSITLPYLPNEQFADVMAEQEVGCVARLNLAVEEGAMVIHSIKKDRKMRLAKLHFTVDQWTSQAALEAGNTQQLELTVTLWEKELQLFGINNPYVWQTVGRAMIKQTPMFITGVVDYEESEKCQINKLTATEGGPAFMIALRPAAPICDIAGSIGSIYGIPVSRAWVKRVACPAKKGGVNHRDFTFDANIDNTANIYNKSDESTIVVLNEMDSVRDRQMLVEDADTNWLFYAVVAHEMTERDEEILAQLRVMQQDGKGDKPLGEMLTDPTWNPTRPEKWCETMWDGTLTLDPAHPALVEKAGPMRTSMNAPFYIYAINADLYAEKAHDAQARRLLIGGPKLAIESADNTTTPAPMEISVPGAPLQRTSSRFGASDDEEESETDEPSAKRARRSLSDELDATESAN